MTTTRNGHEYRQSGVPGLVIFGKSSFRNFTLYAEVEDGQVLPVLTGPQWPTVREAKAAAARIADLLPWGSADLVATVQADLDANRRKLVDALTQVRP
jgi:hypothetical protein